MELENATRPMTYGEKAVGISFNPSNDKCVQEIKELYAKIIDICDARRTEVRGNEDSYPGQTAEIGRLLSVAITSAQTAQMWAVKAVTFK